MKHRLFALCLLCLLAIGLMEGCTTRVDSDYYQYLENNHSQVVYPHIAAVFGYGFSPKIYQEEDRIYSFMGGIFNFWDINMYAILSETFKSEDFQNIFIKLHRNDFERNKIMIDDVAYEFKNCRAYINMRIETILDGKTKIVKEYHAEGRPQRGKMYWGKTFAMKNAIQQSTKTALDSLFLQYFTDLSAWWRKRPAQSRQSHP